MKRSIDIGSDSACTTTTTTTSFGDLPYDVVKDHILPYAYGFALNMGSVCKAWAHALDQYQGWFNMALQCFYYRVHHGLKYSNTNTLDIASRFGPNYFLVPYGGGDHATVVDDTPVMEAWEMLDDNNNPLRTVIRMLGCVYQVLHYLRSYNETTREDDARFKNYIGRLLVAKYPRYELDTKPLREQSGEDKEGGGHYYTGKIRSIECRLLQQVVRYVQSEAANVLVRRNFHPRDLAISFKEEGHRYTLVLWDEETSQYINIKSHQEEDDNEVGGIDGDAFRASLSYDEQDLEILRRDLRSQTTFIKCLHDEFNADEVLTKMRVRLGDKWDSPVANPKYHGKSDDQIKQEWETNRVDASTKGTATHLMLENRVLGRKHVDIVAKHPKEYQMYLNYETKHVIGAGLRPYRAEWMVWDAEMMLCGSIDIVYEYVDAQGRPLMQAPGAPSDGKKHLVIGDYKRSKEIIKYNSYQSMNDKTLACHAGDCNYVHYTIQLCGYKYMLEKNYGVVVDGMFLIVLHPDQRDYIRIEVSPQQERDYCKRMMESIWVFRKRQLEENAVVWREREKKEWIRVEDLQDIDDGSGK